MQLDQDMLAKQLRSRRGPWWLTKKQAKQIFACIEMRHAPIVVSVAFGVSRATVSRIARCTFVPGRYRYVCDEWQTTPERDFIDRYYYQGDTQLRIKLAYRDLGIFTL